MKLILKYVWKTKIKNQLFVVRYSYYLPETNTSYDLAVYFLIYTPVYFATKSFTAFWKKQIIFSLKSMVIIVGIWIFTCLTHIPLIILKIVKYWHTLILVYIENPQEFGDNYFPIHESFFLQEN